METQKVEQFKKQLEDELALVERELKDLGVRDPRTGEWEATEGQVDESATEQDELADRVEEFEERGGEVSELQAREGELKSALERIESGTYGTCEVCQGTIEEARLEANPAARTCTAHMQAA